MGKTRGWKGRGSCPGEDTGLEGTGQWPWSAGRRGAPNRTPCMRWAGSCTAGGAPQPRGALLPVLRGGSHLWWAGSPDGGPRTLDRVTSCPSLPPGLSPGSAQRAASTAGLFRVEGGSQAGHTNPPASPRLPRKCGWWLFKEPTPLGERGQGQVGLGAGRVRLCLVSWSPPYHHPCRTGVQG